MQMRERLAQREGGLMGVERTAKQHRQQFDRIFRALAEGTEQRLAARGVVRGQFVDAGVRPKNGRLCDGSTSVSAGRAARSRASETKYCCNGLPAGSCAWTLILGEIFGNTWSPAINTPSSAQ